MSDPIKKNVNLHKGATFKLQFRLKHCGAYIDLSGYTIDFVLSDKVKGEEIIHATSGSSPTYITVDTENNSLVTIELPPEYTADIEEEGSLYMQIDTISPDGERDRRWVGDVQLYEAAADDN